MKTKSLSLSTFSLLLLPFALCLLPLLGHAQWNYYNQYGLLPEEILNEMIGEASGERAFNHIIEMSAYNRVRPLEEYATTLEEANYVIEQLHSYGIKNAQVERFGKTSTWKGLKGKLWEVSPGKTKIVDYEDLPLFLASGSSNADVTAELIWIGDGRTMNYEGLDMKGKIGLTSGSLGNLGRLSEMGLIGLVSFESSRSLIDPLQIPTGGMRSRNGEGFAFRLPPRAGHVLRDRLMRGEKIEVHAEVEATQVELDIQVPSCVIEGRDKGGEEVIICAHIFEGYVKQGANDNISGSAAILEMARMLQVMIDDGRIERPKRGIRFIWVPEFSGTIPWAKAHKDLMERTLCNINLDMVGIKMMEYQSRMNMHRTTMGNPHYINDVLQCYMRYISENNIIRCTPTGRYPFLKPIVAPTGTDDPFIYSIEAFIGASDHAVFNDWGVGVPGICLNNWPDHFYHTSNDRPWICDPTQMKRVAFLGVASAYSIANADETIAAKITGEVLGNAQHRIGHQLTISSRNILDANTENLAEVYKKAIADVEAVVLNEKQTSESVSELARGEGFSAYISMNVKQLDDIRQSNLLSLKQQMELRAGSLLIDPIKLTVSKEEKAASKIIPLPTELVRADGYRGYSDILGARMEQLKEKYPHPSVARYSREVNLLCNGSNSVLDIKKLVDVQQPDNVELIDLMNYLEILKAAGLVRW
jgi:aminopeptidase YwaD